VVPAYFSIFPVKDKKPLVKWEDYQNRLATSEEKLQWEKSYPNSQRGIVCGKISRIFVLDDDGGLDSKEYKIPSTWTTKTPKGGRHYYFKWIPELENKVTTKTGIFDKVDVRGEGGFVVAYPWEKPIAAIPLANPPQWLITMLPLAHGAKNIEDKAKAGVASASWLSDALDDIKEGNRNASFTRIAGSLRARGYSVEDIFSLLKSRASEVDFDGNELKTICESVGRYERGSVSENASSIESFLEDIEQVEWICEPIIAKKTIGFTAGLPETMKTWILIDLAVESAKGGGMWLNRFLCRPAKVLFIDQERFKGETQRRFKAVIAAKNLQPKDLRGSLFIRCGTTTRLNLPQSFDAFRKELSEIRPDLVIIDSFAAFHTAEENNRQSIQEVLERVKQLRNEFGCAFVFIHHENKFAFRGKEEDREPSIAEMSGSVAIPAVAEFVLTVRRQNSESSFVYHTKSTLASTISPFLVKVVDLDEKKSAIKVEAY